jgi:hypothetical protein
MLLDKGDLHHGISPKMPTAFLLMYRAPSAPAKLAMPPRISDD